MSNYSFVTAADCRKCLTYPSKTIETSIGSIEYADRGEGPVLLSAHGSPGGYDQGLAMAEVFRKNGYRIISPSRPGYLGSDVSLGESVEAQGDALAALLEALDIPHAIALGTSGGGPPTYQLAERHPDKVKALIEIDSITLKYDISKDLSKVSEFIYLSNVGVWLSTFLMKHFPKSVIKQFLETESSLDQHEIGERVKEIMNDDDRFAFINTLFATMYRNWSERKHGFENDMKTMNVHEKLPLSNIACPSLIMHGENDADLPDTHSKYACSTIETSELYYIMGGSHVGFWLADSARESQTYALNWLSHNTALRQTPDSYAVPAK